MDLATVAHRYYDRFTLQYGASISSDQWSALNAILGCRTDQYGKIYLSCNACGWQNSCNQSCGHRSCNKCQNQNTTQWLARQTEKLLPVDYFMVTFTLPFELRSLARNNQKAIYSLMFSCAVATLKEFGVNDRAFAADLAMTVILHTHTRRLDYHPHVHIIVPGGGLNKKRNLWSTINRKYLFNGFKLSAVFKGKLLNAINKLDIRIPATPKKWVAQCQHVGRGLSALKYLSRYLYRGVISNKSLLADDGRHVTFQYTESKTGKSKTRRMPGEDFIKLILQHVLPKGFRRVRDYGFLHGNAKRILKIVQLVLRVYIPEVTKITRPEFLCPKCRGFMSILGFSRSRLMTT